MKNKAFIPSCGHNKWLRLSFSLLLACGLALILFLLPVTAGPVARFAVPALPVQPDSSGYIDLSLPFGAWLVRASNGLTITKLAPAEVDQGGTLLYAMVVTNNTTSDLTRTLISDPLPVDTTCGLPPYHREPPSPPYPRWGFINNCALSAIGWRLQYNPFIAPISFTIGSSNILTFAVTVGQPLPDGYEIVNKNYQVNDGLFSDTGDSVTTTVRAPTWSITKTVSSDTVRPGEYLTYTVTVRNVGRLALTGVYTITDMLPNDTDSGSVRIQAPGVLNGLTITWVMSEELAINETLALTYAIQVTTPLTNGALIVNQTYSVTGGNVYTGAVGAPITTTVTSSATLAITKTASSNPVQAGDLLTYTLIVTNNAASEGAAFGVVISDILPGDVVYQAAGFMAPATGVVITTGLPLVLWQLNDPLAPGVSAQVTVTVRVNSPLQPGFITNTFAVTAANAAIVSDTLVTAITSTNLITLSKSVAPTVVAPGDPVTYTITLTNSGNSIAVVNLVDLLPPGFIPSTYSRFGVTVPGRTLLTSYGSAAVVFAATAPLTPGLYYNQVVTATYDLTEAVISHIAPVQVAEAVITLTKSPSAPIADVGQTITYTYTISNQGNITLTNITLTDNLLGLIIPISTTLGLGESTTATATTVVRENQLPQPITNTALVTGTYLATHIVTATATASVILTYTTEISLAKIALPSYGPPARVGDIISYTYYITNTGSVTLSNITLFDNRLGSLVVSPDILGPDESASVIRSLVITEGQLPGPITNTATVTGTNILSQTTMATATASVSLTYTTRISLTKTYAASSVPAHIGDSITYTYAITNSGSVTLSSIVLRDDRLGPIVVSPTILGPGLGAVVTRATTVVELNMTSLLLTNTAVVTGFNLIVNQSAVDTDTIGVPLTYTIGITVDKTANLSIAAPGDRITYTYYLTNTGEVTLTVALYDTNPGIIVPTISSTLGPKQGTTGVMVRLVSESDLPGPIVNTAIVTGANAILSRTVVATDMMSIPLTYTAAISLQKTANVTSATLGQVITYTYIITNNGNVSLDNIVLFDDKLGLVYSATMPLLPQWTTTVFTQHVVSVLDFDDYPYLVNTATVTAEHLASTLTATAAVTVTLVYTPHIELTKTANVSVAAPGQVITYTYFITNTGNVTLTNINLTDDKILVPITISPTILAPNGGVTTGVATYTVIAGDIPVITNTAIVTGNDIRLLPITDTKTLTVSVQGILTITSIANSSPTPVHSPTFFTVTTNITSGVTYTWNFGDGSFGSGPTPNHTYTTVGVYTVIVTATNNVSTVSATTVVTITPGPLDHFNLSAISPQTAGIAFTVTITAVDFYDNLINTFNQAATISDTTGTIIPTSVTLVNGTAVTTFTVFSATTPTLDIIQAITGTISGTVGVEIRPNVPAKLSLTVLPTQFRQCQTTMATATLTDNWNNPVPGETVTIAEFPPKPAVNPASVAGATNSLGVFSAALQGIMITTTNIYAQHIPVGFSLPTNINIIGPPVPSAITVTVSPASVPVGGTAVVTAQVSTCPGAALNGIVVTFTIPASATVNPATATTNASGIATATVTAVNMGTTVITGTVEGPRRSDTPFTILPLSSPALTITKTATPPGGNVSFGQFIVYQLVVSNSGTGAATGLIITDALDTDVGYVNGTITSGSGPFNSGGVITFAVPSLAANTAVTATIQVTVTATTSGTVINNAATASSNETGNIGNTTPIIAHRVITGAPGVVYLPIIFKNFVPTPDLYIAGFELLPGNIISVTVVNSGTAATDGGFWVDLYANPVAQPGSLVGVTADRRWDSPSVAATHGMAWAVPVLGAGSAIVLTSNGSAGGLAPDPLSISWPPSGPAALYAYADSYDGNDPNNIFYVEIPESNEYNNQSNRLDVTFPASIVGNSAGGGETTARRDLR